MKVRLRHTPGPWYVRQKFYIGRPGRMSLGEVKCGDVEASDRETHEANATLMSASPELLEACMALPLDILDNDGDVDAADFKDNAEKFMRAMRLARKAIVKATTLEDDK